MPLYISPSDLLTFYDRSRVLQLCTDGDIDAVAADLSSTSSSAYSIAIQACRDASADIDTHCQQGKRYSRADLEAIITAATGSPSDEAIQKRASAVRRLAADLAFYYLNVRRGYTADRIRSIAPRSDAALETLEQLANGQLVLDLDANLAASVPQIVGIGSRIYRPGENNHLFGIWPDQQSTGSLYNC